MGSLVGSKTTSGTGNPTFMTPISYQVTIKTAKTGELDSLTIVETGMWPYAESGTPYSDTYTPEPTLADPNPTPIPGTSVDSYSSNESYQTTSTYYLSAKSFGGKYTTSSAYSGNTSKTTFTPTNPAIAPIVISSSTGSPSTYVESYSDGGLATVKSKNGKIQITLSQPYSDSSAYSGGGATSTGTTTTTIKVSSGKKPKMTLAYSDVSASQSTGSTPSSDSTTASASGKAKGDLEEKVRSGTKKILAKTSRR